MQALKVLYTSCMLLRDMLAPKLCSHNKCCHTNVERVHYQGALVLAQHCLINGQRETGARDGYTPNALE